MRESPALDVMGLLHAKGAIVSYADPFVPELHGREWSGRHDIKAVDLTRGSIGQYDCVVIVTDHKAFDYDAIVAEADIVVDTRNAIKERHPHVFRLGAPHPEGERQTAVVGVTAGRLIATCRAMDMAGVFWASIVSNFLHIPGLPGAACDLGEAGARPVRKAPIDTSGNLAVHLDHPGGPERSRPAFPPGCPTYSNSPTRGRGRLSSYRTARPTEPSTAVGEFVRTHARPSSSVRLIEVPAGGKPLALNAGVSAASGDILVFR